MEKELRELGLGNYESKALAILLSERLNIRRLSEKAKIPFGKIYSVIKNLKEKCIVKESNSRPKLIYIDNASEVISKLFKEKQEKERKISEKLREIATEIDLNKNRETKFFQIGTTIEENKNIQLRTFIEAKEEVLQIINIYHKPQTNRKNKTIWEKAILNSTERGVIFKSIYPRKTKIPNILEKINKYQPKKFQIRRFDTDFIRCDIIDNDKILLKIVHQDALQFGGVLFIENEKLNENLRNIFTEMWEQAE